MAQIIRELLQENLRNNVLGERYGIEIEIEGSNLPSLPMNQPGLNKWVTVGDGSLRNGVEYITSGGFTIKTLLNMLSSLQSLLARDVVRLNISDRCGVHIHVNVQNLRIPYLYNLLTIYFFLEESLVNWCGPEREANCFCMRAVDAEGLIDFVTNSTQNPASLFFAEQNVFKYSAMNLGRLSSFGTVEFRAMPTPTRLLEFDRITVLLRMLDELKQASKVFSKPNEVINKIHTLGYRGFIERYIPTFARFVNIDEKMLKRGMLLVQDIAHSYEPKLCQNLSVF